MTPVAIPLSIIVVEPHHAGNIGSLCRACKTMGVTDIILVNPQVDYLNDPDTFRLGWASEDLIRSIAHTPTLAEALAPFHLTIATTHRHRTYSPPIFTPKEVIPKAVEVAVSGNKVAFVFGRENHGLSEEELNQCQMWSSIPSHSTRPALNLAQSVMLYVYEWYAESQQNSERKKEINLASIEAVEAFYAALSKRVERLPIKTRNGPDHFVSLLRRILGRTFLEKRDLALMFKWLGLAEGFSSLNFDGKIEVLDKKKRSIKQ